MIQSILPHQEVIHIHLCEEIQEHQGSFQYSLRLIERLAKAGKGG